MEKVDLCEKYPDILFKDEFRFLTHHYLLSLLKLSGHKKDHIKNVTLNDIYAAEVMLAFHDPVK